VQSALLEAMAEKQVTLGDQTFKLPVPFLVMATQNPIEQEGTYPLPEAQVDRFMLKVKISFPQYEEERKIIRSHSGHIANPVVQAVVSIDELMEARDLVKQIYLDEKIEKYILDIVFATRSPEQYKLKDIKSMIIFGASPRASINIALAAKAHAFLQRRAYVVPDDVKAIAADVLRHRIGLSFEAEAENISTDDLIKKILATIQVP
jgi:MoxR-like ATPase